MADVNVFSSTWSIETLILQFIQNRSLIKTFQYHIRYAIM